MSGTSSSGGTAAVVLAGGSGSRVGAEVNKVLLDLDGVPVLAHSLRTVASLREVDRTVVVAREADLPQVRAVVAEHLPGASVVVGGGSRADSERAAFALLADAVAAGEVDLVAVHDGARPLAGRALWRAVLAAATTHGGALPARGRGPLLAPEGLREDLVAVSTPQAFAAAPLLAAYEAAAADGFTGTDTASYVERFAPSIRVACVSDPERNLKVTWPGDLERARALLATDHDDQDDQDDQGDRQA